MTGAMRWGLVGTGPWAQMVHAPSLTSGDAPRLTTVWGRDPAKAAALADRFGVGVAGSVEELLDQVEAVSFAIAPQAQAELARRALERGRRVLLEKPLGTEPEVVRRFAQEIPADSRATVFLTRLFEPTRSGWVRDAVGRGYTGAHVEWVSSALSPGSVYADSPWRRGTGIVWDLMPHVLSQVVPVLGAVVEASAEPWVEREGMLVELRHAGGNRTTVRMTLQARPEDRAEWIRFDGPDGSTTSPGEALDFVAAHRAAVDAVESDDPADDDPLLRWATVAAAVEPTVTMSALVQQYASAHPSTPELRDPGEGRHT